MAIIDELSLSKGGGIVSINQQADQIQNVVSIFIGLGGTGVDCVREIKTQVYSRIKPDNYDDDTEIAKYDHIKFLGVDADNANFKTEQNPEDKKMGETMYLDKNHEMFQLFAKDIVNIKDPSFRNTNPEYEWTSDRLASLTLNENGAGGCRQVGRALLMIRSKDFMREIGSIVNAAKQGLHAPEVNVHIFSGLSGGTGSGTFLDACYMIKNQLGSSAKLFGYFFLPEINMQHVANTAVKEYIPINGYAALQELDYCMNIENNYGKFKQIYGGGEKIEWKEPPVNYCHLISATDNQGNVRKDAYSYAMKVACEYALEFLVDSSGFTVRSYLANVDAMLKAAKNRKKYGYNVRYLSIGAASAIVPVKEINTYLATKIFNMFKDNCKNIFPSENDVNTFAEKVFNAKRKDESIAVDVYNAIYLQLTEATRQSYKPYGKTADEVAEEGNQYMIHHYTKQTNDKNGTLKMNLHALLDEGNNDALISKIQTELLHIITNIKLGPEFATHILAGSVKYNLINILNGVASENERELRKTENWLAEGGKEAAFCKAESEWYASVKTGKITGRKHSSKAKYEEYERSTVDREQCKYLIQTHKDMRELLNTLKDQIEKRNKEYYGKFATIYTNLCDTFNDNSLILSEGIIVDEVKGFENSLIDIKDENMQKVLNEEISNHDCRKVFEKLLIRLANNQNSWKTTAKLSRLVINFFVGDGDENNEEGIFANFASKTIQDYLMIIYDTTDMNVIEKNIRDKWLYDLQRKAAPLFYNNTKIFSSGMDSSTRISIPFGVVPLANAANDFQKNLPAGSTPVAIANTGAKDRIFFMTYGVGFPISSLMGIEKHERDYYINDDPGRHYYEGMPGAIECVFDDWRDLPCLTPMSIIDSNCGDLPKLAKEKYDVKKNVLSGIDSWALAESSGNNQVTIYAVTAALDFALSKIQSKANEFVELNDTRACTSSMQLRKIQNELLLNLDKLKEELMEGKYYEATPYVLSVEGSITTPNDSERVKRDTIAYSPIVLINAKNSIKKLEEADEKIRTLIGRIKSVDGVINVQANQEKIDFFEALFTGIIQIDGRVARYIPDEDEYAEEIFLSRLSDSDDEYQYMYSAIAPYQAFIYYMEQLDDEMKKIIRNKTNSVMSKGTNAIHEVNERLKLTETFSNSSYKIWMGKLNTDYLEDQANKDIKEFLNDLMRRFKAWCEENKISIAK